MGFSAFLSPCHGLWKVILWNPPLLCSACTGQPSQDLPKITQWETGEEYQGLCSLLPAALVAESADRLRQARGATAQDGFLLMHRCPTATLGWTVGTAGLCRVGPWQPQGNSVVMLE